MADEKPTLNFRINNKQESGFLFARFQEDMRIMEFNECPRYIEIRTRCIEKISSRISDFAYNMIFDLLTDGTYLEFEGGDEGKDISLFPTKPNFAQSKASELAMSTAAEFTETLTEIINMVCPLPKKRKYTEYNV